jgi:hypothetical protein
VIGEALRKLEEVGSSQHGYFTRAQAVAAGLDDVDILRLTRRGDVHRLGHGVYKFRGAGDLRWEAVWIAWLRLMPQKTAFERTQNPDAVVAGRTAAWVYNLGTLDPEPLEFIVAGRRQTRQPHVHLRRAHLTRNDWEVVDGLPLTRPVRIICDLLAQHVDQTHVVDVATDALRRGILGPDELARARLPSGLVNDALAPGRRGSS